MVESPSDVQNLARSLQTELLHIVSFWKWLSYTLQEHGGRSTSCVREATCARTCTSEVPTLSETSGIILWQHPQNSPILPCGIRIRAQLLQFLKWLIGKFPLTTSAFPIIVFAWGGHVFIYRIHMRLRCTSMNWISFVFVRGIAPRRIVPCEMQKWVTVKLCARNNAFVGRLSYFSHSFRCFN